MFWEVSISDFSRDAPVYAVHLMGKIKIHMRIIVQRCHRTLTHRRRGVCQRLFAYVLCHMPGLLMHLEIACFSLACVWRGVYIDYGRCCSWANQFAHEWSLQATRDRYRWRITWWPFRELSWEAFSRAYMGEEVCSIFNARDGTCFVINLNHFTTCYRSSIPW
jgi:hypothetical protein